MFVQCHQCHKDLITAWVKKYISGLGLPQDASNPRVDDSRSVAHRISMGDAKQAASQAAATVPLTKFHYMHGDASYKATSVDSGSKGRSSRSSKFKKPAKVPTHIDLDVTSWANVVKKRSSIPGGSPWQHHATRVGTQCDNSSQQSGGSDKSTIQSGKSLREQELEAMVDKLSSENEELKHFHQATLAAQQELIDTNNWLMDQITQVQSQLSTVKDDMRQEFDYKFNMLFKMVTGSQSTPTPPIVATPFHPPNLPIAPSHHSGYPGMPKPSYYYTPPIHYNTVNPSNNLTLQDHPPPRNHTQNPPLNNHTNTPSANSPSQSSTEPMNLSEARTDQNQHVG